MCHSLCTLSTTALVLSLTARSFAASLSLNPAATANQGISDRLDASFAGFGIEPSNLFSFTGGADDPNVFTVQLLQNLADYSGTPPHIRLGGNTQDYMIYDANYSDIAWKKNPLSTAQGAVAADSIIFGSGYFKALDRFPKGTPVTFGLNMAYSGPDYLDKIVESAQGAVDGMKNVKLYSFEIGNEPDLWIKNSFRTAPWSGNVYTEEFLDRADAVYNRVLKPKGLPAGFFEGPATASTIGTSFEISQLVSDGLLEKRNGNDYVFTWNQHDYYYFIGVTPTPITLDDLMDLDTTNTQFKYWAQQVDIGLKTGLPYVLREMSSVGPIGMRGVSDAHGSALWTLNFFLYAASLNISSVQMHMTDNSNASAWQPIPMGGSNLFVRPIYYAHAAMAQIIGNGNGTTQIGTLNTGGARGEYRGRIRAYAAYAQSNLQSLILINSRQANVSQSNKESFTFNINLGKQFADKDVYLSYLTGDGADSFSSTTWNGMQYQNDTGKTNKVDRSIRTIRISSTGALSIPVRDSEALVANIGWLLGTNEVLTVNNTRPSTNNKKSAAGWTMMNGASTAMWTSAVTTMLVIISSFVHLS
ncbi:glycoside hydrolase superfamily [Dendryphion nanum]|uniref:Glycoside hydrolase superfamily n=1 Tax=Dendryphion nanum TaxID=256645 RepID=A0A9P9E495_9PLEO|nr:glycoside hydrolase superfamily [Dendryphion nanum]